MTQWGFGQLISNAIKKWGDDPKYSSIGKSTFHKGGQVTSMLERGEFVVRKDAVAKYGSGVFEKLNSMIPQPAMQAQMATAGGGPTYNITISPSLMAGDRSSMRTVASVLKEELDKLSHRWGN